MLAYFYFWLKSLTNSRYKNVLKPCFFLFCLLLLDLLLPLHWLNYASTCSDGQPTNCVLHASRSIRIDLVDGHKFRWEQSRDFQYSVSIICSCCIYASNNNSRGVECGCSCRCSLPPCQRDGVCPVIWQWSSRFVLSLLFHPPGQNILCPWQSTISVYNNLSSKFSVIVKIDSWFETSSLNEVILVALIRLQWFIKNHNVISFILWGNEVMTTIVFILKCLPWQIACIGPLIYGVLHKCCCSLSSGALILAALFMAVACQVCPYLVDTETD